MMKNCRKSEFADHPPRTPTFPARGKRNNRLAEKASEGVSPEQLFWVSFWGTQNKYFWAPPGARTSRLSASRVSRFGPPRPGHPPRVC